MIIQQGKDNFLITANQDEVINIWASLLYLRSQHSGEKMPRVDNLIKEFSQLLK